MFDSVFLIIFRCEPGVHIGRDDLPDAEWDWLKMWTLNALAGLLCYMCAKTAAKVKIQVYFFAS